MAGKYLSSLAAFCYPKRGLKIEGIPLMLRQAALSVGGTKKAESIQIADLGSDGRLINGSEKQLAVDVVITSAGLSPLTELAQVAGCPLRYLPEMGGWVPVHSDRFETPRTGLYIAGSISGVEGAGVAEIQGRIAGLAAAGYLELANREDLARDIKMRQKDLFGARQAAIPFFPQIEKGRAAMNLIWRESHNMPID
jgi:sarcosine oxidase subunit alpha